MFIVGMISWWYGTGWKQCASDVMKTLASVYDYFSIDLLLRTLFSPFRQISAGKVSGPLSVQFRAWIDKLISRVIGGIMRTLVVVIGSITLVIAALVGLIRVALWPLVPIMLVAAVVLAGAGWVPWTI